MVIPVVKAAFVPFFAIGGNPANARVARLCGVLPCPVPDTTTALPKQARYQLRYTRLFSLFIRPVVFSQMWCPANCATAAFQPTLFGGIAAPKGQAIMQKTRASRNCEIVRREKLLARKAGPAKLIFS